MTKQKGRFSIWKIGGIAIVLLILISLATCGDKKTERTVTPMTTTILGPAGDMFEVVDKPRTLSVKNNYFYDLSVKVKRTAEGSIEDLEWGLELLDENDEVIFSDERISVSGTDILESIKVGEEGTIKINDSERLDDSDLKKITKFRVTSKVEKKTEQTVTPMTTSILGPVGDMFEVVDKSCTLTVKNNDDINMIIKVKRTAEGSIEDLDWGLELLDENDDVIFSDEYVSVSGTETLEGIKVGEEGSIKMHDRERLNDSDLKKITKFRVTSKVGRKRQSSSAAEEVAEETVAAEEVAEKAVSEEVVADDAASASSGGEDWDKILDEYEKYVDKTVALYKKAQAGDISAMTEYASLLESAQSLQEKLQNAGSDLSPAQAARLSKIAAKMAKAAM